MEEGKEGVFATKDMETEAGHGSRVDVRQFEAVCLQTWVLNDISDKL